MGVGDRGRKRKEGSLRKSEGESRRKRGSEFRRKRRVRAECDKE